MKSKIIILVFGLLPFSVYAQKEATKPSTKSEIDNLYDKYKSSETITLFTPYGDLVGKVTIDYNDEEKPISVKISGESSNEDAVTEFLINTIKMKIKQGYKRPPSNELSYLIGNDLSKDSFWQLTEGSAGLWTFQRKTSLKKGTMYFILNAVGSSSSPNPNSKFTNCYWSIETGDSKRKGGSKASKFEF